MEILEVKDLKKSFGKTNVIKGVTFSMKKGEILGILGPNGAGKTTTLQMLLGILTPTSGSVHIFGKNIATHKSEILEHVNFSSTYTDLPYRLTVRENLIWSSFLYDIKDRGKRLARIKTLFRLEPLWKKTVSQLSAGQRTRLNLAKAMINFPELLLLDEPTASLDPEVATYMREFFAAQRRDFNTSIILTSHNMAEVEELCDRVLVLKEGKLIANDTPGNLRRKLKKCRLYLHLTSGGSKLSALSEASKLTLEGEADNVIVVIQEDKLSSFLQSLNQEGITYDEISIEKPTLEDYFLTVAKRGHDEAL